MHTADVFTKKYWNDTGIPLESGTRYRISVVPNIGEPLKDASYTAASIAGEDWKSLPHRAAALLHAKRVDDARWFALIGTVDRSHPFVITDGGTVVAPADGELVCYFNDVQDEVFYRNNSGWIRLQVEAVPDTPGR